MALARIMTAARMSAATISMLLLVQSVAAQSFFDSLKEKAGQKLNSALASAYDKVKKKIGPGGSPLTPGGQPSPGGNQFSTSTNGQASTIPGSSGGGQYAYPTGVGSSKMPGWAQSTLNKSRAPASTKNQLPGNSGKYDDHIRNLGIDPDKVDSLNIQGDGVYGDRKANWHPYHPDLVRGPDGVYRDRNASPGQ